MGPLLLLLPLLSDLVQVSFSFPQSFDSDFTFTLPAGRKECFYQTMKKDATLEIEYQVIDGAGLDVDFYITSPNGNILYFDQRKSDGVHSIETENGDYMFCFDNSFSSISEKIVFFELILDNMEPEGDPNSWKDLLQGGELLDMKLEDILESINSVKGRLSKSNQIQGLLRAFEARDRNLQEGNYDRVNFWSVVNLAVMLIVSCLQVYMLKNLFNDKRRSRT
ncbi:transmembrane emp24 domain-containing protein 5 isoform X1 [Chiloscyllium plagiosum]|uniref:transmembrane emp24 domain-containing protein 5 isoform X1 n=1 Tax=Chiloscyllium plagiosum TaxID=36176 RepID=UPI001CB872DC|nr:transmembrane emp24 domain-containing protein 5 isoform X1 [Chiloscyllium plagiosum]